MTAPNLFTVSLLQTCSTHDRAANIAHVDGLARRAAADGADIILTPEVVSIIEPNRTALLAQLHGTAQDPAVIAFGNLARELGVWFLAGSVVVRADDGERAANRSVLFDDTGAIRATYDKLHMFDVQLPGGESYRESKTYAPGAAATLAETPFGMFGLSICYDLRFPQLYRDLAMAGAGYLTVPSAFTRPTGAAHWQVLLQARAIETGCYVFAPAQTGDHSMPNHPSRKTWGHSLIVDPWGRVLADGGDDVGVITHTIDPAAIQTARDSIPSLGAAQSYTINRV